LDSQSDGVSSVDVDIDGTNLLQIKTIEITILTFETLPSDVIDGDLHLGSEISCLLQYRR
jgi:hypothetical protein